MATGDPNNDSNDQNNPPPGGSSPPTGGSSAAIDNLSANLKNLQDHGKPDIKLSKDTVNKYLNIINTFHGALKAEHDKMKNLETLGNPGTLPSALQTKANLQLDVTGPNGIETILQKYLDYLDEFATTVKKAADNLVDSG